ncbi:MAG: mitochondrial fission ELM1 family protein, partial [Pseudomonadota bacterium]|nr:mitochondrial fission ELM1 family protein [Pseudomonadota bacterium]
MKAGAAAARVIWRFSDGRPGHDNQSLGLAEALARLMPVQVFTLAPLPPLPALAGLLTGRAPAALRLPAPDLILGAGHRTHLSLLAARRSRGGRAVVLMSPSLPLRWFDLCLIPEHDDP